MDPIIKALSAPFKASEIDWRVGSTNPEKTKGIALAYLQARPVMDRLDEVLGPQNWQDAYTPIQGPTGLVGFTCSLSLKFGDQWVTKTDGSDTSDVEPIKGGFSDAFKRAAVKWGIGRYLYDLETVWMPLEPKGRSYVLKTTPTLPAWALPAGEDKKKPQLSEPGTASNASPEPQKPEPSTHNSNLTEGNDLETVPPAFMKPAPKGMTIEEEFLKAANNPMTLEEACKVTNSAGTSYQLLDPKTLSAMSTNIGKAKNKEGLTQEEAADYDRKLEAIKIILRAKAAKEIK